MKRKVLPLVLAIGVLVVALSLGHAITAAQAANTYTIDWYSIDNGGTLSLSGGPYALSGTIGQADAGTLSGGNYQLNGGFWNLTDLVLRLFLPLIKR